MRPIILFKESNRAYLLAFLAFAFGCLFYLFCRRPLISVVEWLLPDITRPLITYLRGVTLPICSNIPTGFLDALPDGLWAFSYATLIMQLWFDHHGWMTYFWLGTIPLVCVGYEMLQIGDITPGRFSWIDLHFSLLGMALGILLVVLLGSIKR